MRNRILQACGRRTEKEVRALSERLANGQPLPRAISWEKEPAICFRPDASGKLAVRGSFDTTRSVYVLKVRPPAKSRCACGFASGCIQGPLGPPPGRGVCTVAGLQQRQQLVSWIQAVNANARLGHKDLGPLIRRIIILLCGCTAGVSAVSLFFSKPARRWESVLEDVHRQVTFQDLDITSTSFRNRIITAGNASFEVASTTSPRLIIRNPHSSIHDVYTVNEREPIGAGAFGSVLYAVEKRTGSERAVKKICKEGLDVSEIHREVEALRMVNHPNVCKLIEYYESDKCVWLVMELCKGGDLCSYLLDGSHETIPEEDTARIFAQMLMAVQHCHAKGLIHRDIKPENFLFTAEEDDPKRLLKLIDFGCSITFLEAAGRSISAASAQAPNLPGVAGAIAHCSDVPARSTSPASGGTVLYMSPQALRGTAPTPADDMWSLGVVFHILLTGRFPFSTNDEERIRRLVQQGCFEDNVRETLEVLDKSHAASDLARRMLASNPSQRITIEEAMSHPFVAETIARMRSEHQQTDAMAQRQTSRGVSFFGFRLSDSWLGRTAFTASHA